MKRRTSDATYGSYTMGKLAILKLRDDYRAQQGAAYSLQKFHDAFLRVKSPRPRSSYRGMQSLLRVDCAPDLKRRHPPHARSSLVGS